MPDLTTFSGVTGESSLGHLRVLTVIGERANATVYLAEWITPVGGFVAVKRGAPTGARVSALDASALLDLDHPRVATVFDVGTDDTGRPYVITDFVSGLPLRRFCETYDLTLAERIELMLQIVETLEYVHARGVRHLNLKSSNVLVAASGGIRLVDFHAAFPSPDMPHTSDVAMTAELISGMLAGIVPEREEHAAVDALRTLSRRAASWTDDAFGAFSRELRAVSC